MHDNSHCINCALAVAGPGQKFCPGCGQPTPAHRIDWHFLGHELEHSCTWTAASCIRSGN